MKNDDFLDYLSNLETDIEETPQSAKDKCFDDVYSKIILKQSNETTIKKSEIDISESEFSEYNNEKNISILKHTSFLSKLASIAASIIFIVASISIYSIIKTNVEQRSDKPDVTTLYVTTASSVSETPKVTSLSEEISSIEETTPATSDITKSLVTETEIVTVLETQVIPIITEIPYETIIDTTVPAETSSVTTVSAPPEETTTTVLTTTTEAPSDEGIEYEVSDENSHTIVMKNGINYEIISEKAVITGCDNEKLANEPDLIIPEKIMDYPVVKINDYAFYESSNLKSLVIPKTVKTIGEYAFAKCSLLKTVKFNNCSVDIGNSAFLVSAISSVDFGNGNITINSNAFRYTLVEEINVKRRMTFSGVSPFGDCYNLKKVVIDSNVILKNTFISNSAFVNCQILSEVEYIDHDLEEIDITQFSYTPFFEEIMGYTAQRPEL